MKPINFLTKPRLDIDFGFENMLLFSSSSVHSGRSNGSTIIVDVNLFDAKTYTCVNLETNEPSVKYCHKSNSLNSWWKKCRYDWLDSFSVKFLENPKYQIDNPSTITIPSFTTEQLLETELRRIFFLRFIYQFFAVSRKLSLLRWNPSHLQWQIWWVLANQLGVFH